MAKKEEYDLPDDFDPDEIDSMDFDVDMDMIDGDTSKKSRKPVTMKSAFKNGFVSAYTGEEINKAIENALPRNYSQLKGDVENYYRDGASLVSDTLKDVRKEINRTKIIAGKLAKTYEDQIPGFMKKIIDKYASSAEIDEPYRRESDEARQASIISAEIEALGNAQLQIHKDSEAREALREGKEEKRFQSQQDLLFGIKTSADRLTAYQEQVTNAYQKKMIEIGYRQLFTQINIDKTLKESAAHSKEALDAIVKNSALPDIVKAQKKEVFKDMLLRRVMTSSATSLSEFNSRFRERLFKNAKDYISGALDGVRTGVDSAESVAELTGDLKEMGMLGNDSASAFGAKMAGKYVGAKINSRLINSLYNRTNKKGRLDGLLQRGVRITSELPTKFLFAEELMSNEKWDSGLRGIFKDLITNTLSSSYNPSYTNDQYNARTAKERAEFDNAAHTAIVNVIPGYLSRIHQSVERIRVDHLGGEAWKESDKYNETVWDYDKQDFTSYQSLKDNVTEQMSKAYNLKGIAEDIRKMWVIIDKEGSLEKGYPGIASRFGMAYRDYIFKYNKAPTLKMLTNPNIFNAQKFTGLTNEDIGHIQGMILQTFPFDEAGISRASKDLEKRQTEFSHIANNIQNNIVSGLNKTNELTNTNAIYQRALKDTKAIKNNKDGSIKSTSGDFVKTHGTYRSSDYSKESLSNVSDYVYRSLEDNSVEQVFSIESYAPGSKMEKRGDKEVKTIKNILPNDIKRKLKNKYKDPKTGKPIYGDQLSYDEFKSLVELDKGYLKYWTDPKGIVQEFGEKFTDYVQRNKKEEGVVGWFSRSVDTTAYHFNKIKEDAAVKLENSELAKKASAMINGAGKMALRTYENNAIARMWNLEKYKEEKDPYTDEVAERPNWQGWTWKNKSNDGFGGYALSLMEMIQDDRFPPSVATKIMLMNGFAYVGGPNGNEEDAKKYRLFNDQEILMYAVSLMDGSKQSDDEANFAKIVDGVLATINQNKTACKKYVEDKNFRDAVNEKAIATVSTHVKATYEKARDSFESIYEDAKAFNEKWESFDSAEARMAWLRQEQLGLSEKARNKLTNHAKKALSKATDIKNTVAGNATIKEIVKFASEHAQDAHKDFMEKNVWGYGTTVTTGKNIAGSKAVNKILNEGKKYGKYGKAAAAILRESWTKETANMTDEERQAHREAMVQKYYQLLVDASDESKQDFDNLKNYLKEVGKQDKLVESTVDSFLKTTGFRDKTQNELNQAKLNRMQLTGKYDTVEGMMLRGQLGDKNLNTADTLNKYRAQFVTIKDKNGNEVFYQDDQGGLARRTAKTNDSDYQQRFNDRVAKQEKDAKDKVIDSYLNAYGDQALTTDIIFKIAEDERLTPQERGDVLSVLESNLMKTKSKERSRAKQVLKGVLIVLAAGFGLAALPATAAAATGGATVAGATGASYAALWMAGGALTAGVAAYGAYRYYLSQRGITKDNGTQSSTLNDTVSLTQDLTNVESIGRSTSKEKLASFMDNVRGYVPGLGSDEHYYSKQAKKEYSEIEKARQERIKLKEDELSTQSHLIDEKYSGKQGFFGKMAKKRELMKKRQLQQELRRLKEAEDFKENFKDVYVKGENSPRLTIDKLMKGHYYDKNTGKIIQKLSDITGPVIDHVRETFVLTDADVNAGVVDSNGNEVISSSVIEKNRQETSSDAVQKYNKENEFKKGHSAWLTKTMSTTDVYVVVRDGENKATDKLDRRITRWDMMFGRYYDAVTRKQILKPGDIRNPVIDSSGNTVISKEDLEFGLRDSKGRTLSNSYIRRRLRTALDMMKFVSRKTGLTKAVSKFTPKLIKRLLGYGYGGSEGVAKALNNGQDRAQGLLSKVFSGAKRLALSPFTVPAKLAGRLLRNIFPSFKGIIDYNSDNALSGITRDYDEAKGSVKRGAKSLLNGIKGLFSRKRKGEAGQTKGSFASGGYTGDGGKFEPAGVLHRNEYVMTKEAVKRLGVPFLDQLNYGHSTGFKLSGIREELARQKEVTAQRAKADQEEQEKRLEAKKGKKHGGILGLLQKWFPLLGAGIGLVSSTVGKFFGPILKLFTGQTSVGDMLGGALDLFSAIKKTSKQHEAMSGVEHRTINAAEKELKSAVKTIDKGNVASGKDSLSPTGKKKNIFKHMWDFSKAHADEAFGMGAHKETYAKWRKEQALNSLFGDVKDISKNEYMADNISKKLETFHGWGKSKITGVFDKLVDKGLEKAGLSNHEHRAAITGNAKIIAKAGVTHVQSLMKDPKVFDWLNQNVLSKVGMEVNDVAEKDSNGNTIMEKARDGNGNIIMVPKLKASLAKKLYLAFMGGKAADMKSLIKEVLNVKGQVMNMIKGTGLYQSTVGLLENSAIGLIGKENYDSLRNNPMLNFALSAGKDILKSHLSPKISGFFSDKIGNAVGNTRIGKKIGKFVPKSFRNWIFGETDNRAQASADGVVDSSTDAIEATDKTTQAVETLNIDIVKKLDEVIDAIGENGTGGGSITDDALDLAGDYMDAGNSNRKGKKGKRGRKAGKGSKAIRRGKKAIKSAASKTKSAASKALNYVSKLGGKKGKIIAGTMAGIGAGAMLFSGNASASENNIDYNGLQKINYTSAVSDEIQASQTKEGKAELNQQLKAADRDDMIDRGMSTAGFALDAVGTRGAIGLGLTVAGSALGYLGAGGAVLASLGPIGAAIGVGLLAWAAWDFFTEMRKKPNTIDDYRWSSYGIDPRNGKQASWMHEFEKHACKVVTYDKEGKAVMPEARDLLQAKDAQTLMFGLFGEDAVTKIKTESGKPEDSPVFIETVAKFTVWYRERFVPTFTRMATVLHAIDPKKDLYDAFNRISWGMGLDDGFINSFVRRTYFEPNEGYNPYKFIDIPFALYQGINEDAIGRPQTREVVEYYRDACIAKYSKEENRLRQAGKLTELDLDKMSPDQKVYADKNKALSGALNYENQNKFNPAVSGGFDYRIGEKNEAAIQRLSDVTNKDGSKAQVEMSGRDAYVVSNPLNVKLDGRTKIDDLIALRMRAYGLVDLVDTRVRNLLLLEQHLYKYITFDGAGGASYGKGIKTSDIIMQFGMEFGWTSTNADVEGFTAWFMYRFTPIFLKYCTLVRELGRNNNIEDSLKYLKPDQKYNIAIGLVTLMVKIRETELSIWNVPFSPIKGVKVNSNQGSVMKNMQNLSAGFDRTLLTENDTQLITDKEKAKNEASTSSNINQTIKDVLGPNKDITGLEQNASTRRVGGIANAALGVAGSLNIPSVTEQLPVGDYTYDKSPPSASQQEIISEYIKLARADGVDDVHIAMALSTMEAESGLVPKSENMKYSVSNLLDLKYQRGNFGKGYTTARANISKYSDEQIKAIANSPDRERIIANIMYGGRDGSGPDEGYKYRGRGLIGHTHKSNYEHLSKVLGLDLVNNPELLNEPKTAVRAAHEFYKERGLYKKDFDGFVRGVAGSSDLGDKNMGKRKSLFAKYMNLVRDPKFGQGPGIAENSNAVNNVTSGTSSIVSQALNGAKVEQANSNNATENAILQRMSAAEKVQNENRQANASSMVGADSTYTGYAQTPSSNLTGTSMGEQIGNAGNNGDTVLEGSVTFKHDVKVKPVVYKLLAQCTPELESIGRSAVTTDGKSDINGMEDSWMKLFYNCVGEYVKTKGDKRKFYIYSAYRDYNYQKRLYEEDIRKNGGKPSGYVASPEGSRHCFGVALDIKNVGAKIPKRDFENGLLSDWEKSGIAGKWGFWRRMSPGVSRKLEDWHVENKYYYVKGKAASGQTSFGDGGEDGESSYGVPANASADKAGSNTNITPGGSSYTTSSPYGNQGTSRFVASALNAPGGTEGTAASQLSMPSYSSVPTSGFTPEQYTQAKNNIVSLPSPSNSSLGDSGSTSSSGNSFVDLVTGVLGPRSTVSAPNVLAASRDAAVNQAEAQQQKLLGEQQRMTDDTVAVLKEQLSVQNSINENISKLITLMTGQQVSQPVETSSAPMPSPKVKAKAAGPVSNNSKYKGGALHLGIGSAKI